MAKRVNKKETPISKYADFVNTLQLGGLALEHTSATVDRAMMGKLLEDKQRLTVELRFHNELLGIYEGYFSLLMHCDVVQKGETETIQPLTISCSYSATYLCEGRPSKTLVNRFCRKEAKLVVWPYFRHYVSDVTARMSINTILLPLTWAVSPAGKSK